MMLMNNIQVRALSSPYSENTDGVQRYLEVDMKVRCCWFSYDVLSQVLP